MQKLKCDDVIYVVAKIVYIEEMMMRLFTPDTLIFIMPTLLQPTLVLHVTTYEIKQGY